MITIGSEILYIRHFNSNQQKLESSCLSKETKARRKYKQLWNYCKDEINSAELLSSQEEQDLNNERRTTIDVRNLKRRKKILGWLVEQKQQSSLQTICYFRL